MEQSIVTFTMIFQLLKDINFEQRSNQGSLKIKDCS